MRTNATASDMNPLKTIEDEIIITGNQQVQNKKKGVKRVQSDNLLNIKKKYSFGKVIEEDSSENEESEEHYPEDLGFSDNKIEMKKICSVEYIDDFKTKVSLEKSETNSNWNFKLRKASDLEIKISELKN